MTATAAPATTAVLSMQGVSKRFGAVQALKDVDFEVNAGEVVALVGDNGAGKSTLVKTIAGVYHPRRGDHRLRRQAGVRISMPGGSPAARHRDGLPGPRAVRQPRRRRQPLPRPRAGRRGVRSTRWRWRSESWSCCDTLAGPRSRSVRIAVARCPAASARRWPSPASLLGDPKVVMLDEPTAALGVAQTAEVLNLVERLRERGHGVILISHNMADVMAVADRVAVLRLGRNNGDVRRRRDHQRGDHRRHHRGHRQRRDSRAGAGKAAPRRRRSHEHAGDHRPHRSRHRHPADERLRRRLSLIEWPGSRSSCAGVAGGDLGSLPVVIGLIVIWVVFQSLNDRFLSAENLVEPRAADAPPTGTIALGIVLVLLLGEIDLSVGSVSGSRPRDPRRAQRRTTAGGRVAIAAGARRRAASACFTGFFFTRIGVPDLRRHPGRPARLQGSSSRCSATGHDQHAVRRRRRRSSPNTFYCPRSATSIAIGVAVVATLRCVVRGAADGGRCRLEARDPGRRSWCVRSSSVIALSRARRRAQPGPGAAADAADLRRPRGAHRLRRCAARVWGGTIFAVGGNTEAARRAGINVATDPHHGVHALLDAGRGRRRAGRARLFAGQPELRRQRHPAERDRGGGHRRHQPVRRTRQRLRRRCSASW